MLTFKHTQQSITDDCNKLQRISKEKLAIPSSAYIFDTADLPAEVVNDVPAPGTSKGSEGTLCFVYFTVCNVM
jgi:hypothetical protein